MENNTKLIPGFGRYTIDRSGIVRNAQTTNEMKADDSLSRIRVKLVADDGTRKWFYPSDELATIFAEPVEEAKKDPFLSEAGEIVVPEKKYKLRVPTKYKFSEMSAADKRAIHASNKISIEDVHDIRAAYDAGIKSKKEIAAEYGIGWQTAGKICNRKTYQNIPERKKIEPVSA